MQSLQSRNSAFISVVELLCFFTSAWQALLALMGRKYLKTCHLTTQIMCKSSFHKRQYWQCCNILAIVLLPSNTNIFSCLWKQNDDNLFAIRKTSLSTAKIAPEKQEKSIQLFVLKLSFSRIFLRKLQMNRTLIVNQNHFLKVEFHGEFNKVLKVPNIGFVCLLSSYRVVII